VNTLIPHTRTNVQNLVQFIGIVREKYQNKLTVCLLLYYWQLQHKSIMLLGYYALVD
jgi:hypothetical protein